ncbi:hypothetical protein C2S51_033088 [Perilla frutescens var. frutescens]|nr:hypothetical protein C2S51_033088 [Perilla frutescens var. frutescens]
MARSKDDPVTRPLPPPDSLSSDALYFLNSKLSSREDLNGAPDLLSELQIQSDAIDRTLSELNGELQYHLNRHSSLSNRVGSLFSNVHAQLDDLRRSSTHPSLDGESKRGMGEELQALAKEVARVETVRNYADRNGMLECVAEWEPVSRTGGNASLVVWRTWLNSEVWEGLALYLFCWVRII